MPATAPSTSYDSVDTLPIRGYSIDALLAYIRRQLGAPVWNVEYTNQMILDNIMTALATYSQWRPKVGYAAVQISSGQFKYLEGVDVGQGIADVAFVQRIPIPLQFFWGSLIGVTPVPFNGMGELDSFQRWLKTWSRVTSAKPDWQYDENAKALYIHNPIDYYYCAVTWYGIHDKTESLPFFGCNWVKEFAFQTARHGYAELLSKFSGAIPSPVAAITTDQNKRGAALVEIDRLRNELKMAQDFPSIMID
jgi:hypothetical protein